MKIRLLDRDSQNSNFFTFFEKLQDIIDLRIFSNSDSMISNNFFFFACKKLRFENLKLFEFFKNFEIDFSNFFKFIISRLTTAIILHST